MPDNAIDCGLVKALSVNVSLPVAGPATVGANLMPIVQLSPAGMLLPHALLEMMNPVLAATPLSDRATLSRLVTVTVLAELVVFTDMIPKFNELVENVTGALPVPDKFTA